ncbi:MAG: GNAT family N-acetyltransferase [Rhodospirillales bacterium]|jgi:hypothetical protein|nr:GNAT family N-acetyltransferase [Rhodospirillales bacterium]MDP6804767.1 GNAT family N-acetyltransferase [Rhodospirillales bacterium]
MSLEVHLECARHHARAYAFFDFSGLDAFHHADVLSVVHGRDWRSVLITDGREAWLHAFAKAPIGETGHFDVDPFLGYAGPVATTADSRFVEAALQAHSEVCRAENIIAEVFRFNPLLGNHAAFDGTATRVVRAKDIIITECAAEEDAQLVTFTKSCRSSVRRGLRDLAFEDFKGASGMDAFAGLYRRSLDRLGSEAKWYFPNAFLARALASDQFAAYGVRKGSELVSAALAIHHPAGAYYFLAANADAQVQGANELLVYGIARAAFARGARRLILGGGHGDSATDALYRFKAKFAPSPTPFHIGLMTYNGPALEALRAEAVAHRPELAEAPYFLNYRLALYP